MTIKYNEAVMVPRSAEIEIPGPRMEQQSVVLRQGWGTSRTIHVPVVDIPDLIEALRDVWDKRMK